MVNGRDRHRVLSQPLAKAWLRDRGYDGNPFRAAPNEHGIKACIPPKKSTDIAVEILEEQEAVAPSADRSGISRIPCGRHQPSTGSPKTVVREPHRLHTNCQV
jgi:transposase